MCVFQRKTGRISETVRDRAKVTINHLANRIHPFRWDENHRPWMTLKVTDNQYARCGYLSDSWASC